MVKDVFKEYISKNDHSKKELTRLWNIAIGLQKVDGLSTSEYLKEIAIENIRGYLSFSKVYHLINSYYQLNDYQDSETIEADKTAINIVMVLSEKSFVFSPQQYLDIHRKLFDNVLLNAGKIRTYNVTKKEWILNGNSILYGDCSFLKETLEYDFNKESNFDYSKLNKDEFVIHLAKFISDLWQIHVFEEGNTRTTAVFLIKYLKKFGYEVTNDVFAENAWYFRNALVRANYSNFEKGIFDTTHYLELFLRNLIYDEKNDLKNRYLHIDWNKKVDIHDEKVDIRDLEITSLMSKKIVMLYNNLSEKSFFARKDVIEVLDMSPSGASKLISNLLKLEIISPILGQGKGKYVFNIEINSIDLNR